MMELMTEWALVSQSQVDFSHLRKKDAGSTGKKSAEETKKRTEEDIQERNRFDKKNVPILRYYDNDLGPYIVILENEEEKNEGNSPASTGKKTHRPYIRRYQIY